MPFSRQIRSNNTSSAPGPNRPVNTFPLSVRISRGTHELSSLSPTPHTPAEQSLVRRRARNSRTSSDHRTGHDAGLPAVHQLHTANDVHLPHLHRTRPFPPLVVRLLAVPRLRLDQTVTDQTPIHRRPTRPRINPFRFEPEQDRSRTPTRVQAAELHNPRFDLRRHLMRTRTRRRHMIHQPRWQVIARSNASVAAASQGFSEPASW